MNYSTIINKDRMFSGLFLVIAAFIISYSVVNFGIFSVVGISAIAVLALIILKPYAGVLAMGFLYPLVFIAINNVGNTVFMNCFRSVALITFIVWVTRTLMMGKRINVDGLMLLFVLLLSGSLLVSIRNNEFIIDLHVQRITLVKYVVYISLFLFVYNLIQRAEQVRWFVFLFLCSLTIFSILSCMQYFLKIPLVYEMDPIYEGTSIYGRLFLGIGSNPNLVASIYLFGIPFVLNSFIQIRGAHLKIIMLLLCILFSVTLLLTQTRSAIIGVIVAIVFTQLTNEKLNMKRLLTYMFLVIVFYLIYVNISGYLSEERFGLEEMMGRGYSLRLQHYGAVIKLVVDYPLGVGKEYYQLIGQYGGVIGSPHNMFLGMMVEVGFLGFIGYTGLLVFVLFSLWRIRTSNENSDVSVISSSLFCGLIAYIVHNQVHSLSREYLLWMFLAISMSVCRISRREREILNHN